MNLIRDILSAELRGYSVERAHLTFEELGIDSFELLSLRIALEQRLGGPINDHAWTTLETPAQIDALCSTLLDSEARTGTSEAAPAKTERSYSIGMPQMAVSGLSESWLFKELGDLHWQLITDELGTESSQLRDGNGERLYATFTRIKIECSQPLSRFHENERLLISGAISRYGAGIFLGEYQGEGNGKHLRAQMMSSFSRREQAGSNKGLMKGQPDIPAGSRIPVLTQKPEFADGYGRRRAADPGPAIFTCDYRINPYHDINGVGLLYFAAYPTICDTCALTCMDEGNGWAARSSTISRDICYFANSDMDDSLEYQLLSRRDLDGAVEFEELIRRKSDGVPMASVITRKALSGG